MRKAIAVLVVVAMIGVLGVRTAQAQDEAKQDETKKDASTAKQKPVDAYRLDFSFNELTDGKLSNTRRYSTNITTGESNEIKIGTRVPVTSGSFQGSAQYQYMDMGTNIWAQLRERGDDRLLVVRSEVSNMDVNTSTEHGPTLPPVVRQIKIEGNTLLVTGKPIMIGSLDDPNSKRQFQLEVTVTKLR